MPPLTHIINLSISSRKFPVLWKKAKIIPLHKKDDQLNPKNFRPVAILPIFSKIMERVIFNQIIQYLNSNNLLHPNHHAYRSGHNTTTALIQMYDTWINAYEDGELSGVCLLDMSAAFDIVDHSLLLKKMKLYGFGEDSLEWTESYLTGRSQCVSISGSLSKLLPVPTGVPQGSILGPIFYTIFTNELPEVVHDLPSCTQQLSADWPAYNLNCKSCGNICCFADDTTYSCSDTSPALLSEKLSSKFIAISDFLVSNRLKLNDEKTHLLVLTSSQTRKARRRAGNDINVVIATPSATIDPSASEKLLGGWIHQDLKWAEYVQDSDESLVRSLTNRLNALKLIGKVAPFKTRKMLADGIIMSKLSYLISLWGGCEKYLIRSLQVIQSKAARVVTKLDWYTPTHVLLSQCGWLSVHQLALYHTVILAHKVLMSGSPNYLHNLYSEDYGCETRLADMKLIKPGQSKAPEHDLATSSFRWRSLEQYNSLPLNIRNTIPINNFKVLVKK